MSKKRITVLLAEDHTIVREAIREVQKGNTFFSPTVARRLHELEGKSPVRAGMPRPRNARLSSREMEVLQLIAEGKANKETPAATSRPALHRLRSPPFQTAVSGLDSSSLAWGEHPIAPARLVSLLFILL
jgi:hypothetical protein